MDITRTDMSLLVVLDALYQERSVTRAAQKLGISQPAMSAQLAKLRARMGDPCFVAGGGELTPTARIERFSEPLRAHLEALSNLVFTPTPFEPSTANRTFQVSGTDFAHSVLLGPLLQRLAVAAPSVKIAALPFKPDDVSEQLNKREIDLVITSERLIPHSIPARKAFEDSFVVVMHKDHRLANVDLSLDTFCDQRHLLISPTGGRFEGAVDAELKSLGRVRNVVASLPSFLLAGRALANTDAIAVVPSKLAVQLGDQFVIKAVPLELDSFAIFIGWHERDSLDEGHIWLRRRIIAQNIEFS